MIIYQIIGGLIGYSLGNFIGAILGWFLGSFVGQLISGKGLITPATRLKRQEVFIKTVFSLMGCLAKADGRVSELEVTHTENFMTQLGMTPEHRKQAIGMFKYGASTDFNLNPLLQEFNQVCGRSSQLKRLLVIYLLGVAMADGQLHTEEEKLLRQITQALGFSAIAFEQMLNMLKGQDRFADNQHPPANALNDAFQALGVTASDTDAQIKKAYRKLMSEYHPDKLIGQGLPDDMVKAATVRSQEVQRAYDTIKKYRQI